MIWNRRLGRKRLSVFDIALPTFWLGATLVAILATLTLVPFWSELGLPNTADGPLHVHRSAAFARALQSGVSWPRWYRVAYGGLGAPTFHYYAPLFYLVIGALHSVGLSLDLAVKLCLTLAYLGCGLAAYSWLTRLFHPAGALLGTVFYLAQPQLFRELYFQGDYPQLLALLLLPWPLACCTRMYFRADAPAWAGTCISLALLSMAHNLTALIGCFFIAVYWFALALGDFSFERFAQSVSAGITATLLSAFYWVPAIGDLGAVQVDNLRSGFFQYALYFLSWRELIANPSRIDGRAANPPIPHSIGWTAWGVAFASTLVLVWFLVRHRNKVLQDDEVGRTIKWGGLGLIITTSSLWMATPQSLKIWEALSLLALLQFPFRFLPFATLGVCILGGAALSLLSALTKPHNIWFATMVLSWLATLQVAPLITPAHGFIEMRQLPPEATLLYERESGIWGMSSGNEFLPRWAEPVTVHQATTGTAAVALQWMSPHWAQISLLATPKHDAPLILPLHFFPGWRVQQANSTIPIAPDASGLLQILNTVDLHVNQPLILTWVGTPWQHWGQILTTIGLCVFALGLVINLRNVRRRNERFGCATPANDLRWGWFPLAGLLGLTLISLSLGKYLLIYSPPDAVLNAKEEGGAILGDSEQVQLLSWELLSSHRPRPGDDVRLRVYWQLAGPNPVLGDLSSFLHIYSPTIQHSWAVAQNVNPASIPTSRWHPSLYYVDDFRLTLPLDLPPAEVSLAVGLVTKSGERLQTEGGNGLVYLQQLDVQPLPIENRQIQPTTTVSASTGVFQLTGYDLFPSPGGPVLRTFWTVEQGVEAVPHRFVHLYQVEGGPLRIKQYDGPLLADLIPASRWRRGGLYVDKQVLPLPDNLPSGRYFLEVGLFQPETGEAVPLFPTQASVQTFVENRAIKIPFIVPQSE